MGLPSNVICIAPPRHSMKQPNDWELSRQAACAMRPNANRNVSNATHTSSQTLDSLVGSSDLLGGAPLPHTTQISYSAINSDSISSKGQPRDQALLSCSNACGHPLKYHLPSRIQVLPSGVVWNDGTWHQTCPRRL